MSHNIKDFGIGNSFDFDNNDKDLGYKGPDFLDFMEEILETQATPLTPILAKNPALQPQMEAFLESKPDFARFLQDSPQLLEGFFSHSPPTPDMLENLHTIWNGASDEKNVKSSIEDTLAFLSSQA